MSWVTALARPEIVALKPYEHAAWEPGVTRLHANELPWRAVHDESAAGLNRYPEPQSRAVIERLAQLYRVAAEQLLICRGSDEAIDLLVRAFCGAQRDAVLVCPPTFGMYATAARIQGAPIVTVPLAAERGFELDAPAILSNDSMPRVKLIFLCSPNNPTGNLLSEEAILRVVDALAGRAIVVVDEAYIEFSQRRSLAVQVAQRPQLAVLRTLSKAHGLAGARLGTLIADPEVIALLRKLIAPYAVPQVILEAVTTLLSPRHLRVLPRRIRQIRAERSRLRRALGALPGVTAVLPSEANFLLARVADPAAALARARAARLLVRDVRGVAGLEDALRISVGTRADNDRLLEAWQ
ncbi:MAG TPA: histidinol-phosphate transaminase [Steroidobacteraceae bacterium]|nr:histidinol-phosphate transaminase [Steroidobacteraceae bacterium]